MGLFPSFSLFIQKIDFTILLLLKSLHYSITLKENDPFNCNKHLGCCTKIVDRTSTSIEHTVDMTMALHKIL
jgi:hypothetical protein